MLQTNQLIIPLSVATLSAAVSQSMQMSLKDTLTCQVAFLIALLLYHNLMTIEINLHLHYGSNNTNAVHESNSMSDYGMDNKDVKFFGHCYFSIFLALYATLTCRSHQNFEFPRININRYNASWKFSWFIHLMKVSIHSMVPASLVFLYLSIVTSLWDENMRADNNSQNLPGDKIFFEDERKGIRIRQSDVSMLVFIIVWSYIVSLKLKKQHFLLAKRSHPALVQQRSLLDSFFLFCGSNGVQENQSSHYSTPNERDWQSWTSTELQSWVRNLYIDQLHREKPNNIYNSTSFENVYGRYQKFKPPSQGGSGRLRVQIEFDDGIMIQSLAKLHEQKINGSLLPYIQVNDLVALGIIYSHAVFLHVNFQELITSETSMSDNENSHESGVGIDLDKWLGKKIGGNNEKSKSNEDDILEDNDIQKNHSERKNNHDISSHDLAPIAQFKDTNGIMPAHFKQELLKHPSESEMKQPSVETTKTEFQSMLQKSRTESQASPNFQLDPNLLEVMPPNIREIASRNPELVKAMHEKFLLERSQAVNSTKYATVQHEKVVRFDMDKVEYSDTDYDKFDEEAGGGFQSSEYDETNDTNEFSEMVGLLRRRSPNQRLKSGEYD